MITRDTATFFAHAATLSTDFGPPTARAVFLVSPDGFMRAEQSAADNHYMADGDAFDGDAALRQHHGLQLALAEVVPTLCFTGSADTPDAVFPNNVFGTAAGRSIVGRMRHPVRQREATRMDIRGFLRDVLGRTEIDLSTQPHAAELTGALVIDRARGLGYFGLSERCDEEGARLMHDAFGLRASLLFDLAPGEYHTNVVLSVLAGRAVVVCPRGFSDASVAQAIAGFHAAAVMCTDDEHAAFVGNCIAASPGTAWMSQRAADALTPAHRDALATAGFEVRGVPLDAIEAGGGSLRCCVAEIY